MKAERLYDVKFDWFDKDTFERNFKNSRGGPLLKHDEFNAVVKSVNVIESINRRNYSGICNLKITEHKDEEHVL